MARRGITPTAPLIMYVLDMPPLRGSEAIFPGLYFAVTAPSAFSYAGGAIYESVDEWDNMRHVANVRGMATMGYGHWIADDKMRVSLHRGELSTCSDGQLRLGMNRAIVGSREVVSFKGAKLQDDETYLLTGITRGLSGTSQTDDGGMTTFVLLDDFPGIFQELQWSDVGVARQYKAVAAGDPVEPVKPQAIIPTGKNAERFKWLSDARCGGDSHPTLPYDSSP